MRLLFTGDAGRVGLRLRPLLERDHRVVSADRRPGAQRLVGDLTEPAFCARAVAGAEAVLHFAGTPHPGPETFANNLVSTENLARAAAEAGVERFVLASTINVQGQGEYQPYPRALKPRRLPIDESDDCHAEDDYGRSKLGCEQFLEQFSQETSMSVLCLRLAAVWEPERTDSYIPQRGPSQLREGYLIDPWHYLDLRDLHRACEDYLSMASPPSFSAVYLLASDTTASVETSALFAAGLPGWLDTFQPPPRGYQAWFSNRKASELLGWEPRHSCRSPFWRRWLRR